MAISEEKTGKKGKEVTRNKKEIKGRGKKWQKETRKWMCAHLISLLWFFGRKKMKAKTPEEIKFAAVFFLLPLLHLLFLSHLLLLFQTGQRKGRWGRWGVKNLMLVAN